MCGLCAHWGNVNSSAWRSFGADGTCSGRAGRRSGAVEGPIDVGRDGLDLRAQLLLDAVQRVPVLVGDQVHGQPQVAEPPRSAQRLLV